jgi:hypothetical protein
VFIGICEINYTLSQKLLKLGVFDSVFVHDGGGGEAELAGGTVFYA